jgi:hypothetical protein
VALALPLSPARAAPQPLGLVATNGPVPLTCFAGQCTAEFTSFCLQQGRSIPLPGTAFRAVGDDFTLIAIAADGKTRRLPAAAHLTIMNQRGFASIRLAISEHALKTLGAVRAAVEVGAGVTLIPVAVAGDPDPLTDLEIATVTGPLRELADRIVDNAGAEAEATRLISRLINGLPEIGRVGPDVGDPLLREQLSRSDVGPETAALAAQAYGTCRRRAEAGLYYNLRRCLEQQHDEQVLRLNRRYWQSILGS